MRSLFDYCLTLDTFFSGVVFSVASTFKFDVVGWVDAFSIVTFCDVNFVFVAGSFDIYLSVSVTTIVISITVVAAIGKVVSVES